MAVVRPGSQHRQDPLLWNDPLTPGEAKNTDIYLRREKLASTDWLRSLQNQFFDSLVRPLRKKTIFRGTIKDFVIAGNVMLV